MSDATSGTQLRFTPTNIVLAILIVALIAEFLVKQFG
mgnify:CR=1 FL=1